MTPLQSAGDLLQRELWGAIVLRWIEAAAVAVTVFILLILIRRFLVRRLGALAARTATAVDDILIELIRHARPWFLLVLALWPAAAVVRPGGGAGLLAPARERGGRHGAGRDLGERRGDPGRPGAAPRGRSRLGHHARRGGLHHPPRPLQIG